VRTRWTHWTPEEIEMVERLLDRTGPAEIVAQLPKAGLAPKTSTEVPEGEIDA
jgi:hypothetical protein